MLENTNLTKSPQSLLPKLFFILKLLVALALVSFLSMFVTGIFSALNPNFDVITVLIFIFISYFSGKFYQLSTKQNYIFFKF